MPLVTLDGNTAEVVDVLGTAPPWLVVTSAELVLPFKLIGETVKLFFGGTDTKKLDLNPLVPEGGVEVPEGGEVEVHEGGEVEVPEEEEGVPEEGVEVPEEGGGVPEEGGGVPRDALALAAAS